MRCPYGVCDGSGWVVDEEARTATPCRCKPERDAERSAARLSGRIPRRFRDVAFDAHPISTMPRHVVREVRRYVGELDAHLDDGTGLWFSGPPGTGKTALGMLVARTAIERGRSVAVYALPHLLSVIRSTYDDRPGPTTMEILDGLADVDLLHVDDVGAESPTPWVLEQLYSIVNARYEGRRAVTLTTNLDHADLAEQIGARTVSRLVEMCSVVPVSGEDLRHVDREGDDELGRHIAQGAWRPEDDDVEDDRPAGDLGAPARERGAFSAPPPTWGTGSAPPRRPRREVVEEE